MPVYQPSSFLKLLLISFALAVLPLLWAFVHANIAFGTLATASERTISNAVATTRSIGELQEQLNAMERSARQYFVLRDNLILDNYRQASHRFSLVITRLNPLVTNRALQQQLNDLRIAYRRLDAEILANVAKEDQSLAFLDAFSVLTSKTEAIMASNNNEIDQTASKLTLDAKQTQKTLFLQSLILIPLALLMATFVTFLLVRPIRRMDNAIRNLGKGLYERPILIDGPGDLKLLGRRLDWLRKELKELNAQKQQFLRHVSHELKTPLTAIREATELLRDGIGGALSAQQAEIIAILHENSIRLQKMIENLLHYTKLISIQAQSKLQPFNLADVLHRVIQAHTLTIENKQLTIERHFDNPMMVYSDEEKVTIILDNLLSNAVKYTPPAGHILLSAMQEKNGLTIVVSDDGPGLAASDAHLLFDAFYQGNTLSHSLLNSSGIGLTIIKDLVELLGGNITLKPSKQGAHFQLYLPITEPAERQP